MNTRAPLADLAAIVSEINAAATDRARLGGLLNLLAESDIFESILALGSKDSWKRFVSLDTRGECVGASEWKAWPLRKLFDTMLLRRIAHPHRKVTALAIPLEYDEERCVVLAVLSDWANGPELGQFFEALENFAVPRSPRAFALPEFIPVSPVEPRVACFALCPPLQAVVDAMLARRGWTPAHLRNFFELRVALKDAPDVVFWDPDPEMDPLGLVLRMHAMMPPESKLVAFGADTVRYLERQALIDAVIDHDAAEPEIFALLKRFIRQIPELRKMRVSEMTCDFEMALRDSRTPAELSAAGARHAATVMCGWASVHLVSESGTTYASEHPRLHQPVLYALPKAFLSDSPLFQLRADERFYQEISDDRRVVGALELLHPLSAASIPLRQGDQRLGTLVSVSRDLVVDSSTFQALEGFAGAVTRRFQEFAKVPTAPLFERTGVWERMRHNNLEFAAYRSRSSVMAWDYRAVRQDLALLVAGDDIDFPSTHMFWSSARLVEEELIGFVESFGSRRRIFIAACNPIASTLTYAANGFPAPLLFNAVGPAGALSARGSVVRGKVEIAPPAGLLVWDSLLHHWLTQKGVEVGSITEALEGLRPPGVAIVITNSTRP